MKAEHIEYSDVDESRIDLIAELRAQFVPFNQSLAPDFPEEYSEEAMDRNLKRFLARAERGAMRIFLARDTSCDRIIAFCMTTLDEHGEGFIDSFLVDPAWRGKGVGRELFGRALNWLESRSARAIKLNILPANDGARRFYESFGFRPLSVTMKRVKPR